MWDRRSLISKATCAAALLPAAAKPSERADQHVESYRGRTISVAGPADAPVVTIDGRPLDVMRMDPNAYVSALCHYELTASPLLAARKAVDELRGADLLPAPTPMRM